MSHIFTGTFEAANSKLFNWQIRVPADITTTLLASSGKRRVVCALDGQDPHQCALTPIGQGLYVIKVNAKRKKQLGLTPGDKIQVDLYPDDSEYGLPMPEELAAVMQEDPEGHTAMHSLTMGKLRTLLYIVSQGITSDRRLQRAVLIVEHVKQRGKIDYRALHTEIQEMGC